LNPGGDEIFCTRADRQWGPHSVLYTWLRGSFAEFKAHSHLAQRLSLRRAISLRPIHPVVCYGMTFTFTLIQVHNASFWESVNLYLTPFCTRIMPSERICSVSLPQIIFRTPFSELMYNLFVYVPSSLFYCPFGSRNPNGISFLSVRAVRLTWPMNGKSMCFHFIEF